jgi:hypothetical protein
MAWIGKLGENEYLMTMPSSKDYLGKLSRHMSPISQRSEHEVDGIHLVSYGDKGHKTMAERRDSQECTIGRGPSLGLIRKGSNAIDQTQFLDEIASWEGEMCTGCPCPGSILPFIVRPRQPQFAGGLLQR